MKLIIAGKRDFTPENIRKLINWFFETRGKDLEVTEIVSGNCSGVDTAGERYAFFKNIKVTLFPADWTALGKAAGPIRNKEMAKYADQLLLIWSGDSDGSRNMRSEMKKLGKPIYEIILK